MAFYILQHCRKREMRADATLMIHRPFLEYASGSRRLGRLTPASQQLAGVMYETMSLRMNVSAAEIDEMTAGNAQWWFTADQGLYFGAVDRVVE